MMNRRPSNMTGAVALMTAMGLTASVGCSVLDYASYVIAGEEKPVTVTAAYRGMENKSFAVLVNTDEYALFKHPRIVVDVCRAVTSTVAADVSGVTYMDPDQLDRFQKDNPFWATSPPGDLLQRLKVDRLLLVSLVDYSLHEPGNAHVWRGTMVANVDIFEAEAIDPNNSVHRAIVKAVYPADTSIGLVNSNDQVVRFALLKAFGRKVANLFVDHEVMQK